MFHSVLARQGGVNARALARRADGIDSVVVVVANLRHKLRLEHIAVAGRKARRQDVYKRQILYTPSYNLFEIIII